MVDSRYIRCIMYFPYFCFKLFDYSYVLRIFPKWNNFHFRVYSIKNLETEVKNTFMTQVKTPLWNVLLN